MSEKLTVAELLARNARSSSDGSSNRPRRRRRSLEEGGISVAELTGSIPVVTQQDVDEHEERKAKAEQAEAKKTATIKPVGATPAAGSSVPAAGEKSEKAGEKSAEGTNLVKRKAEKPGETTNQMKAVPDTAAATSATVAATSETTAKADKHAGDSGAPAAGKADKTISQQKVAEWTKATEQKKTSDEKTSGKKAAEQTKSDQRKTDAEQKTEQKAKDAGAKARDTEARKKVTAQSGAQGTAVSTAAKAVPADDARKAEAKLTSKSGAAAGVAGVAGAAGAAGLAANSGSKDSKKDAEAQPGTATKTKQNSADKSKADDKSKAADKTKADKEDLKTDTPDEFKELEASLGEDEVIDYEDNTVSWPMMILQAILAVVAGVGIFFGFSLLWANLNPLIVLVLALAVTLVLVGLVHALLRHKDKLLMVLAFFVGLALTIGPRLVMGL
ncbi:DUF2157 domain-containing protein [Corynebacterium urogenitale]